MKAWSGLAAAFALTGCLHTIPLTGDPNTGEPTQGPPIALFSVDWRVKLVTPELLEYAPREPASPVVDPDTRRVIVLTRDGYVRSIDPEGHVEWETKTFGPFNAAAAIKEGVLYVPGADGHLYALKSRTGEKLWDYSPGEELATTPVLTAGKVLVASESNTLYAVEQKTGRWLWQYRRDMPTGFTIRGASAPVVSEGLAYIGFADGSIVALRVDDGSVKWERTLSQGNEFIDVDTTPVLDDSGRVYVASYKDGVFALDAKTGEVRWHNATPGITHLMEGSGILFAGGDQKMSALLASNGRGLWALDLGQRAGGPPLMLHGMLLVPTNNALTFVDPTTGMARLSWNPGKGVSATPWGGGSRLYVLSNLGYLYALRLNGRGG